MKNSIKACKLLLQDICQELDAAELSYDEELIGLGMVKGVESAIKLLSTLDEMTYNNNNSHLN